MLSYFSRLISSESGMIVEYNKILKELKGRGVEVKEYQKLYKAYNRAAI